VTPDDADVVIDNNGAMYDLFDQLDKAWKTVNGAAYTLSGDWNFEKICTDSARKEQGG
jgi:hypothetical protein